MPPSGSTVINQIFLLLLSALLPLLTTSQQIPAARADRGRRRARERRRRPPHRGGGNAATAARKTTLCGQFAVISAADPICSPAPDGWSTSSQGGQTPFKFVAQILARLWVIKCPEITFEPVGILLLPSRRRRHLFLRHRGRPRKHARGAGAKPAAAEKAAQTQSWRSLPNSRSSNHSFFLLSESCERSLGQERGSGRARQRHHQRQHQRQRQRSLGPQRRREDPKDRAAPTKKLSVCQIGEQWMFVFLSGGGVDR